MGRLYLGLGTNLGDKRQNITNAVHSIEERIGSIVSQSALFETEPWGFTSANSFLNAAICVETSMLPEQALSVTQDIEQSMGRKEKSAGGQYADRVIDIDILMYDDIVMSTPTLTIPHPLMHKRMFVLKPLAQIAPESMHPLQKRTISELYADLCRHME